MSELADRPLPKVYWMFGYRLNLNTSARQNNPFAKFYAIKRSKFDKIFDCCPFQPWSYAQAYDAYWLIWQWTQKPHEIHNGLNTHFQVYLG